MKDATRGETVVLAQEEEKEESKTTTTENEEWQDRLKEALQHHQSMSLEKDKTAWIASLEQVRDAHVHLGNWNEALNIEKQLLQHATVPRDEADCFHRMGSLHLQMQHFDIAKKMYESALAKFYEIHGSDAFHADMGKLLVGLGGICVHSNNPQDSLPYLAQAEEHYRNHGVCRTDATPPEYPHEELVTVLANQAVVSRMLGQHQVAIDKYQEIMAWVKDDEEKRDEVAFQIADCLFSINQLSPALDHLTTLLDNHVKRYPSGTTAHEGSLRHLIGVIHSKQSRMDEALRELESAYVIKKETLGQVHPEVVSSLNALGAVHATLGNDGEALSYFRESLMIARIHAGDNHDQDPQVMQTLRNISLVHGKQVPKWE
jgi:tetratricopeptide (TPR) repeat protein